MNLSLPTELKATVRPHAGSGMHGWAGEATRERRTEEGNACPAPAAGSRSPAAFCLSVFFTMAISLVAVAAKAVELGELSLLSKIGQPLHATVDAKLARGETIDDACLSLVKDGESSSSRELFGTGLSLRFNKAAHKIEIRSKRAFKEPYATFRLQVRCAGAATAVSGVFALLPEFGPNPAAPVSIPAVRQPAPAPEAGGSAENTGTRKAKNLSPGEKASPRYVAEARPEEASANGLSPFPLKMDDGQLDMARIGQLSPADLEALLAQRALLDEDDQTAHLLALRQRLKALNEELQSARLKLANLEAGRTSAIPAPEAAEEGKPLFPVQIPHDVLLLLSGVLGLMALGFFGIRSFRKTKVRSPAPASARSAPAAPEKPAGATLRIVHPHGERHTQPVRATEVPAEKKNLAEDPLNKVERTVLEEAELYAVYGHPDKAVRILQEFVAKFPQSEDAWMLLLSIYSASLQVREFESAARKFMIDGKNSPHWKTIQALGRTLDKDNELYSNGAKDVLWLPSSSSRHRPIGDILIELGYLSAQDLAHCLGEFDPKQHGRFGHYLLTRRIINHAQLNEALLKQQTSREAQADTRPDLPQRAAVQDEALPGNDPHVTPPAAAHVQDNAFPLDFVIDDGREKSGGNEPAAPATENNPPVLDLDFELDLLPAGKKPQSS
jgi:Tfp pilus assembly protein FimV